MLSVEDVKAVLSREPCFRCNYINGAFVPPFCASSSSSSSSGRSGRSQATYATISPSTARVLWDLCPASQAVDVGAAVSAARRAADQVVGCCWGALSATARAEYLSALSRKLQTHSGFLAALESLDTGKPLVDAAADIARCSVEIEECVKLAGELDSMQNTRTFQSADVIGTKRYEPCGVVACITPWNFPLVVTIMKLAPALTAGNSVVIKPSEFAPLTTMFCAKLCDEVGFPPGVVNVVCGTGPAVGAPLSQSPQIDMVSFTGSVATGSLIMAAAAQNVVKPLLELGGKSPSIVFEDVDLTLTLPWIMHGFLSNAGQVCISQARLLVHNSIKEQLMERLVAELARVRFALDPLKVDEKSMEGRRHRPLGPIVTQPQYEKVVGFIQGALDEGAVLRAGGVERPVHSQGYFVQPTVLEVEPSHTVWKEEVFGPVLAVRGFENEAEAILLANDTTFGLAATVFSADEERAMRVAISLRTGKVFVNQSTFNFPGITQHGFKRSGLGTEGGMEGLMEYVDVKSISRNLGSNRPNDFMRLDCPTSAKL
jgi:betaine-aldehyde dehydrogenase